MNLVELHVDLKETNRQLTRIADALDRAFPVVTLEEVSRPVGKATLTRQTDGQRWEAWAGVLFEEGRGDEVEGRSYEPRG